MLANIYAGMIFLAMCESRVMHCPAQYERLDLFNLTVAVTPETRLYPIIHDCTVKITCKSKFKGIPYEIGILNGAHFQLVNRTDDLTIQHFKNSYVGDYHCQRRMNDTIEWERIRLIAEDTLNDPPERLLKFGIFDGHESRDAENNEFKQNPNNHSKIVRNPTIKMIPRDGSVRLKCSIDPKVRVKLFWYISNESKVGWPEMDSHKQASLTLDELLVEKERQYVCGFCHGNNCITQSFEVKLFDESSNRQFVDSNPIDYTVESNELVIFKCDTITDTSAYIIWVKTDEHPRSYINGNSWESVVQNNSVVDPTVFVIPNAKPDDEGWYSCVSKNATATVYNARYLRVYVVYPDSSDSNMKKITYPYSVIVTIVLISISVVMLSTVLIIMCLQRTKNGAWKGWCGSVGQHRRFVESKGPSVNLDEEQDRGKIALPIIRRKGANTIDEPNYKSTKARYSGYSLPEDNHWELNRDYLEIGDVLDQGDFGSVFSGRLVDPDLEETPIDVSIKIFPENSSDEEELRFFSELEIMKTIGNHVNIVNLLGVCTKNGPLCLVMEFAMHENLRNFLRKRVRPAGYESIEDIHSVVDDLLSDQDALYYAYQIATGMEYLAAQGCIHGDLAARNVLVTENHTMKITNYAIAPGRIADHHHLDATDSHSILRWMAPESLFDNIYNSASNVWSFGILLWEIITCAEKPYPLLSTNQEVIEELRCDYRMEEPRCCPNQVYLIMTKCWERTPTKRPTFGQLVTDIDHLRKEMTNWTVLDSANERYQDAQTLNWLNHGEEGTYFDATTNLH